MEKVLDNKRFSNIKIYYKQKTQIGILCERRKLKDFKIPIVKEKIAYICMYMLAHIYKTFAWIHIIAKIVY